MSAGQDEEYVHEAPVTLDDALLRRTIRRFINRYIGWKYRASTAVIALGAALLLFQGSHGWYTYALAAALLLAVAFPVLMHTAMYSLWVRQFRRIQDREFVVRLGERRIATQGPRHGGSVEWKRVSRIWRFPDAWLLFTAPESFTILPTADLPPEMLELVKRKVEEHGGEVS